MGVVYLAERADGHHRRRVAIKVVRIDDEQKDIRRRFLAEGRILASLSHPNIAQLLDAGVMDDGSPYIVMEYVDGATITTYCEHQQLTVAARLKLFQDVCAAIHHAHTNLVLHRDVKPGNILVTRDGRVKLLDFGIAKLLEGDAAGDHGRDPRATSHARHAHGCPTDDARVRQPRAGSRGAADHRQRRVCAGFSVV
jgi:serine/threonine-protein kinase